MLMTFFLNQTGLSLVTFYAGIRNIEQRPLIPSWPYHRTITLLTFHVNILTFFQLAYTGVLETTRIRKEGYAVRIPFSDFVERLV